MPSEGKTTAVLNLALVLADAGRRVTIVDADLRRPKVASESRAGRGDRAHPGADGVAQLDDVTQRFGEAGVVVVGSGPTPPDPGALPASPNMATLIEKLRVPRTTSSSSDAPPLLPVADASALAVHADGVLLVVRYGSTGKAQHSSERLRRWTRSTRPRSVW